jgi:hypothetical protein
LERAAYGVLFPHLMKDMIPDTGGRYCFIPLLPVGAPASLAGQFTKVIQPQECSTPEAYRALPDRYFALTWTWEKDIAGQWKLIRTEPALPNFGEMLWNSRGHDVKHEMKGFTDTPDSRRHREPVQRK